MYSHKIFLPLIYSTASSQKPTPSQHMYPMGTYVLVILVHKALITLPDNTFRVLITLLDNSYTTIYSVQKYSYIMQYFEGI